MRGTSGLREHTSSRINATDSRTSRRRGARSRARTRDRRESPRPARPAESEPPSLDPLGGRRASACAGAGPLPAAVPSHPGERPVVGEGVHGVDERRPGATALRRALPAAPSRPPRLLRPAFPGDPRAAGGARAASTASRASATGTTGSSASGCSSTRSRRSSRPAAPTSPSASRGRTRRGLAAGSARSETS